MKHKLIVTILFLIFTSVSLSFEWNRCKGMKSDSRHALNEAFFTSSSTTGFTSSTGRCSMLGEVEHDKKVFLALNKNEIMFDAANGGGRYLDQYAKMNNCFVGRYRRSIHNNYSVIFQNDSSEEIYNKLEGFSCLKPNS